DYIFSIEDDGTFPPDALKKLLKHMQTYPEAGFISGLEIGRWTTAYIGGWTFDNPSDPKQLQSVMLGDDPIIPIHAAGLYCCLIKRELYEGHKHAPTHNWGADIEFGRQVSAKGYQNYMDTSIVVDHHTQQGKVIIPTTTNIKHVNMVYKK